MPTPKVFVRPLVRAITSGDKCALEIANPKFASTLGVMMNYFTLIEWRLPGLLLKLFPTMTSHEAFVILGSISSFAHRLDLVEKLANQRKAKAWNVASIRKNVAALREANSIRNVYVHGFYSHIALDLISIETFYSDARRTAGQQEKSTADAEADLKQIKRTYFRLQKFLIHGKRSALPIVRQTRR